MLPEKGLGLLYGAPGVGKTFVGLDLALTLAAGWNWPCPPDPMADEDQLRHAVPVLYWIGEGEITARSRVGAWHRERFKNSPHRDLPFHFLSDRHPDLLLGQPFRKEDKKTATVGELVRRLEAIAEGYTRPPLLVVDTLAATHPGLEENDARATGILMETCRRLINEAGAAVLLIHHSGKNRGGGPRGHSRLTGDPDLVMHVARLKQPHTEFIRCDVEKQRMQQPPAPFYFSLGSSEETEPDTVGAMPVLTHHKTPPVRSDTRASQATPPAGHLTKGQRSLWRMAKVLGETGEDGFTKSEAATKLPRRMNRMARSTIYAKLAELEEIGVVEVIEGKGKFRVAIVDEPGLRKRIREGKTDEPAPRPEPEESRDMK